MVTVTEIDLPRQRIALSMRSSPQLGGRQPAGGPASGGRPGAGPRPAAGGGTPKPRAPQTINSDWFSAALNKKR
jgi:uncharacterized protein